MSEIRISDLPYNIQHWCELIGLPNVMKIVERWGGRRLYLRRRITPDHDLATLVGVESAQKIADEVQLDSVHGDWVLVPKCTNALKQLTKSLALLDLADGYTVEAVAEKYGLHMRTVYRWKNPDGVDDRQIGMF